MKKFAALLGAIAAFAATPAAAQDAAALRPTVQTQDQALAEDAAAYAARHSVPVDEAVARLRAQEASVAATDRIAADFRERLAGISIEHEPNYRIVVLLTGDAPVPSRFVPTGGMAVPVVFRTGAAATQDRIVRAIAEHRPEIVAIVPGAQGMGFDPRTGELVVHARGATPDPEGLLEARIEALTGVPVAIRALDGPERNMSIEGGARVEGSDPGSARRQYCTTGFVVTDGSRTGIVTAAHCPDSLTYYDPDGGGQVPLTFVGSWGAQYQDVQVHVAAAPHRPLFYADTQKRAARALSGARTRVATRGGEALCHRGETTGYSCSEVDLVDYAPPGDLCGGPCDPVWVTVRGPGCRAGDSGGPVFSGTVAFGILKGGNYRANGTCNFYYYMSTDFLPEGWSLLRSDPAAAPPPGTPGG